MDEVEFLKQAQESLKEYQNCIGCKYCKSKAEIIIKAIDELILLHTKAKEFYEVLQSMKYLKD